MIKPPWMSDAEWASYMREFGLLQQHHHVLIDELETRCIEFNVYDVTTQMRLVSPAQAADLREMFNV